MVFGFAKKAVKKAFNETYAREEQVKAFNRMLDEKSLDVDKVQQLLVSLSGGTKEIVDGAAFRTQVLYGAKEVVKILAPYLVNGAINHIPYTGTYNQLDSALMIAAGEGDLGTMEILVDAGANINLCRNENISALTCAIEKKQHDATKYLISKNAYVSERDVLAAIKTKDVELARMVLATGVHLSPKTQEEVMATALRLDRQDLVSVVREAVLKQCERNDRLVSEAKHLDEHVNRWGDTWLTRALQENDEAFALLLLKAGANPWLQNVYAKNAFDLFKGESQSTTSQKIKSVLEEKKKAAVVVCPQTGQVTATTLKM